VRCGAMKKFRTTPFKWVPFSLKQKKVLTWWMEGSTHKDKDGIVCDGSVRAGKTIVMSFAFVIWAMETFNYQNFIIAGKTIGAFRRNVLFLLKIILRMRGYSVQDKRADNLVIVTHRKTGTKNYFYIFGGRDERSQFTMDDNPSLTEQTKQRYMRMFSGVFFKRFILGLWVLAEGIIYDMWDEEKHVFDYSGQEYNEYYVAIDYATSTVMTFGLYGIERNKDGDKVFLIKEYYYDAKKKGRQKTDSEFADDFETFLGNIKPRAIYIDPSAASFKAELKKRGYMQVKNADNDVVSGMRLVATFLATGRFFVERNCRDTIKEFGSYVWDSKAQERGEDKPLKENDHAMDRNRYFIYTKYKKAKIGVIDKPKGW